jgi:hypothetical protein
MQNIVALAAMVTLVAFLVWSGVRAWRARRPLAKWGGVVLAAALAVPLSGVSALTAAGIVRQHARSAPVPDLKVEATPERILRGRAVATDFARAVIRRAACCRVAAMSARIFRFRSAHSCQRI